MQYEPSMDNHNLPYNPFKACVIPRPIAWISTISLDGIHNLAPFSQFQNLSYDPPYVMIALNQNTKGKRKDTAINIEETGEFVYNMVPFNLAGAMNKTSVEVGPEVDEFEAVGLNKISSIKIKPARVKESPVQFECVYYNTIRLPGIGIHGAVDLIIGKVVMIHIKDEYILSNGKLDILKIRPLARLGYSDYTTVDTIIEMQKPTDNELELFGLYGASVVKSRAKKQNGENRDEY